MPHQRVRRILILFLLAFGLNFLWEEAHHVLYVSYQGGEITQLILLRAAVVDAVVTAVLFGPLLLFARGSSTALTTGRSFLFVSVFLAVAFAVGLEMFALSTDRWVYQPSMPLIPFFHVGLTPTIQLAVLGAIAFRLSRKGDFKNSTGVRS